MTFGLAFTTARIGGFRSRPRVNLLAHAPINRQDVDAQIDPGNPFCPAFTPRHTSKRFSISNLAPDRRRRPSLSLLVSLLALVSPLPIAALVRGSMHGRANFDGRQISHAASATGRPPSRSHCRRPAVCRITRPPGCGVDAALDRAGRSRPGRDARTDRRRLPLRRGSRHQVRDVRRAARARRDDRRASPRRVASRRAPAAPRARGRARAAAARARRRAVARRPRGARRIRTKRVSAARSSASTRSSRRRRCPLEKTSTAHRCRRHSCRRNRSLPTRRTRSVEVRDRVRAAIASLPPRERKVIGMYYYAEATMKQIGVEIGVNESRVSQLARARRAAAAQGARRRLRLGRGGSRAPPGDPLVPADDAADAHGQGGSEPDAGRGAAVQVAGEAAGRPSHRAGVVASASPPPADPGVSRPCRAPRAADP